MRSKFPTLFLILFSILSIAQPLKSAKEPRIKVAFLIYPEIAVLDYTGPMDVFIKANRMTANSYELYTVSKSMETIQTQGHVLETHADYSFETAPSPDILIVPGAKIDVVESLAEQKDYTDYIKKVSQRAKTTMSVCTGSFILGKLGLLDGKKATTHWVYGNKFTVDFPGTELVRDVRYVEDGNLITTSGVTAGIDGAIALIAKYSGKEIAGMIARGLQHQVNNNGKWPQMPKNPWPTAIVRL